MLTEVEIKEEPLDENEIQQEMFNKREGEVSLPKQQQHLQINVKNDSNNSNGGHFHIVEERDQVITVSAADMKTNDELQFIEKLQTTKDPSLLSNIVGTCPKCLKKFSNITMFTEHTRRNHCVSKRKCPACPLTFIDTPSLQKHLNMHRDNLFFCSRNCGENFKNLPLCEQHERRVHKLQNPPKIRYKHFCSYCREGFKTELQLHVHWLQQSMGCGKLMQEVVALLFYTASIESNNNNSSSENKNEDNTLGAIKRPIPSTLPVTKLRLKSNLPPLHASKRPIEPVANDMDINQKRSKIMDNIKEKISMPEQMLFNVNTDIQIKEEPVDEEDVINTTPLVPEVIIKTEEENQKLIEPKEEMETPTSDKPIEMKSLLINDNKELNPELQGKIIPMILQKNTGKQMKIQPPPLQMIANCNNNSIVTNNNVKIFPSNKLEKSNNSNIVSNIIPVHNISNQGNTNNSLKNITNLKFVRLAPTPATNTILPPNIQVIPVQQQPQPQQSQMGFKVIPAPKMSLQIIKLVPSTNGQMMTLPNTQLGQQPQIITNFNNNNNIQQPMNILKLQNFPTIIGQPVITLPSPNMPASLDQTPNLQNTSGANHSSVAQPAIVAEQKQTFSFTLDSSSLSNNEFTKIQTEALQTAEKHRIQYISKKNLIAIESLPEKKQLIDTMKQQIAKVAVASSSDTSLEETGKEADSTQEQAVPLLKITKDVTSTLTTPDSPPTLYLPIMTSVDVELVELRFKYPNFVYKWICPYCLKDYDIKRCLKSHLMKSHNLTNRDMEKINVQAKAFINEDVKIDPSTTAPKTESTSMETIKTSPPTLQADNSSSNSSLDSVKMSALKNVNHRYVCDKCGRKCSSKTMLNDHISANCSREPQYPCSECPKKFYSSSTLQCHMTIHTGELPHKCNYCDKRFRTRGQVTVHHRIHTGEKPFVCQVCSQRFTHRETLIAHLSRHLGMKRYRCYGCDKHFSCISALKTHREIRPDTCGKVKFNPRAIGPRVRVVRGNVIFEAQPEINPYLRSEDPANVLADLQNQPESVK